MRRLAKILSLSFADQRLAAEAFVAIAAMRTALLIVPIARLGKIVAWAGRKDGIAWPPCPEPSRVVWAIRAVGRLVPGGENCLVRALAGKLMLARRGYASELRIGAQRNDEEKFEAHAWLECGGKILIGEFEPGQYAPMVGNPGMRI
jgi:hypothetical protein